MAKLVKKSSIIWLAVVLLIFPASEILAQRESLSISIQPRFPNPGQNITATLKGFGLNLDAQEIAWFLDGSPTSSGTGRTTYSFTMGDSANSHTLSVVVNVEGEELRASQRVTSAEVDLIWEADSHKPQWYLGKSLFTPESTLTFVAIPHFNSTAVSNPEEQIYTWSVDGRVLGNRSGFGRNQLVLNTNLRDESFTIIVEVESPTSGEKARKRVVVRRSNPRLRIYEKNPLLGTLSNSAVMSNFTLTEEEVTFVGVPFFTNSPIGHPSLEYSWRLNNKLVGSQGNQVTFRQTGEEGRLPVSVVFRDKSSVLTEDRESFEIIFTKNDVFE